MHYIYISIQILSNKKAPLPSFISGYIQNFLHDIILFQVILAIIAIIIQYIIPCIIVLICYILICYYLSIHRPEMLNDARQKIVLTKRKRNNQMLMLVATAHFLSWLPLNVVNLIGKKVGSRIR